LRTRADGPDPFVAPLPLVPLVIAMMNARRWEREWSESGKRVKRQLTSN
jgi:hypothetical protein